MRLGQLRSFVAVARAGGFTAAAEQLQVSQPALTAQVRHIEEQYGVELFHRGARKIRLTETGERLLAITGQLDSIESDAIQLLTESGGLRTGRLRVGAVGPFQVTDMLAAFLRRYPGVTAAVSFGNSETVLQGLLDFGTDVAVLAQAPDDPRLHGMAYNRTRVIAFAPAAHRLARRRSIRLEDLDGEAMIVREEGSATRKAVDAALARANVRPRVILELTSREAIREAVAKGLGIGTVSEAGYVPDPRLRVLRIAGVEIWTEAHVMCLRARRSARPVQAFFEIARELQARGPGRP